MKPILAILSFCLLLTLPGSGLAEPPKISSPGQTIYTCPMHPEVQKTEPGLCPICGMSLIPVSAKDQAPPPAETKPTPEKAATPHQHDHQKMEMGTPAKPSESTKPSEKKAETYYTCPMHPQIHTDKPGTCPICGMTLVKTQAGGGAALPPSTVPGFASIRVTPEQQWLIGVKTGPVTRQNLTRRLRTFGTVAYDPNLYIAQKEYLEARKTARASGGSSFVEASRRKLTLMGMTDNEVASLTQSGKPDDSLFLTEGTGKAWIYSVIYESERPLIRKGLKVSIRTVGHPQKEYLGEVDAILPVVDPMNRTIRVRSVVDDPIALLRPDMFVDVYIEIPLGDALSVPKSAVLQTGQRNIALVTQGNGIFEPRDVTLGNQSDDEFQIISGLNEGETVVTSAAFLLDSESQIKGAFASGAGGHQHGQ